MDRQISKYLLDVKNAISEIEFFLETRPKEYETFCKDLLFRRAVERNIEIMGEAMNRALKLDPHLPISNARKVVDTRNFVIHAYDSLRADMLWAIVVIHLPLLKKEIDALLNE